MIVCLIVLFVFLVCLLVCLGAYLRVGLCALGLFARVIDLLRVSLFVCVCLGLIYRLMVCVLA